MGPAPRAVPVLPEVCIVEIADKPPRQDVSHTQEPVVRLCAADSHRQQCVQLQCSRHVEVDVSSTGLNGSVTNADDSSAPAGDDQSSHYNGSQRQSSVIQCDRSNTFYASGASARSLDVPTTLHEEEDPSEGTGEDKQQHEYAAITVRSEHADTQESSYGMAEEFNDDDGADTDDGDLSNPDPDEGGADGAQTSVRLRQFHETPV